MSVDAKVLLYVALTAVFCGLAVIVAAVLGLLTRGTRPEEQIRRRLSIYTVRVRPAKAAREPAPPSVLGSSLVARSAVGLADRVVEHRGLDVVLRQRLEAAALPLRTAEWLLIHVGIAAGAGVLLLLLSGGTFLAALFGLVLGLIGPWLFLTVRQGRRVSAFLAQLPDTLQLLAGSLKAGYSLPQALDAVVHEGTPPMTGEFSRALFETQLGRPVEEALEGIAQRMNSPDFSWVAMAIQIQRDVGGNLAELLITVSDTLRERERLRRQVQVLSAEGRLSGWILGALPVAFTCYLLVARPEYLQPLGTPAGIVLVVTAVCLLVAGGFWIARIVKVEV